MGLYRFVATIAKRPRLGLLVKKLQITGDWNWDRVLQN